MRALMMYRLQSADGEIMTEIDEKTQVDARIAYRAMEIFLGEFCKRGGNSEDLIDLLSWLPLSVDGQSSDPAQWFDWMNALARALHEQTAGEG
jgi:hypothetical protein